MSIPRGGARALFAVAALVAASSAAAEGGDRMGSVIAAKIELQRQLAELLTKSLAGPAEPYRIEVSVRLDLRGHVRELREKLENLSPAVKIGGKNKVKLPGLGTVEGGGQAGLLPEINIDGGGRVVEQVTRQLETEVAQMTLVLFVDPVMPKDRRELLVRLAGELAGIDTSRGDKVVVEERPSGPASLGGGGGFPTLVQATLQTSSKLTPEIIAVCVTALVAAAMLAWGLSRRSFGQSTVSIGAGGRGGLGGSEEHATPAEAATAAAEEERKKRREEVGAFKVLADATPAELVQVIAEADAHTATAIVDLFGVDADASKLLEETLPSQRRLEIGLALASQRVLTRDQLGQMENIAAQVLQRVRNRVPLGGPARLAEFLSNAPSAVRHQLLDAIAARDEAVAQAARSAMLLFEDLPRLAEPSVRQIVAGIDPATIALAMVGAPEVRDAVLNAVSKRLRGIIEVEEEVVKDKPAAEIEAARRLVEDAMRSLQGRGELRARAA